MREILFSLMRSQTSFRIDQNSSVQATNLGVFIRLLEEISRKVRYRFHELFDVKLLIFKNVK